LNLTLLNRIDRRVRIEEVRLTLLHGEEVVRAERPGSAFFQRTLGNFSSQVDEGGRLDWTGVCLQSPGVADRVRVDLTLTSRKGMRTTRSVQSKEVLLREAPPPRSLKLPFQGYWRVTQGHHCGTSHRVGGLGGDYAWDFVAVDRTGKATVGNPDATRRNRDSFTFGRPVQAPIDGRVIRVVDDVPDNEGLKEFPRRSLIEGLQRPEWVFGNFIVLDIGEGAHLLFAHLARGSISARPGDRVRAGDPIARCGNSGNSVLPHLHVQVMDRADPSEPNVTGLPAMFTSYTEITAPSAGGGHDMLIRRVAVGDPPEESIVAPFYPDSPGR
jgi:hypothetical protein